MPGTHHESIRKRLDNLGGAQADDGAVEALLAQGRVRRHAAGEYLARRGMAAEELLFLLSGSVEVSACSADGRRAIAWYLAAAEPMNVIPVIDGGPSIHDFLAHTDVTALHVPATAVRDAIRNNARLGLIFLAQLCTRSRATYDALAAEGLLPLRARVARTLVMLAAQHGQGGAEGVEIQLRLTQEEYADMLGVSRQSLNRELRALEQAGAISLTYARLVVRDLAALREFIGQGECFMPLATY